MQTLGMSNKNTIAQLSHSFNSNHIDYTISAPNNLSSIPKLGDNENIRIITNGNLTINNDLALSGVRSIIIEQGNLTINKNITYANS
jgi:hypothetical protein